MHGIRGGNILLCTGIWCLTASAECCSPPLSQMPFSCAGKRVLLCSGEGWLLLVKMSDLSILFLQLWSLWHKTAAPKVVRQTAAAGLCCWGWAAQFSYFLGKMLWAEWENGSESAPPHRALALISVTWKFKITYLAQRKSEYAQTKWCRYLKVQALIVLWKFLLVYILVGGLEDLLSSHWQGNIHKIKKSLLSLACYSFKALLFYGLDILSAGWVTRPWENDGSPRVSGCFGPAEDELILCRLRFVGAHSCGY